MLAEYNIKSKEARKYIFNCLDDMSRVNMPKYEASELVVEKVSNIEFLLSAEHQIYFSMTGGSFWICLRKCLLWMLNIELRH